MSNINFSKVADSLNATALVDSRYPHRWLEVWGPDVDKAKIDDVWKADEFTVTASGTSPITASIASGAVALITTGGTEYNGDNIQLVGTRFKLEAGKPVYFGAKLTISDATQSDLLVGLAGIDTTLLAGSSAHAVAVGAGFAGFTKLDGVTACNVKTITTATEQNTASALTMDDEAHIYEMYWNGTSLNSYIDGSLVATFTENITTEVLTPSIAFLTGDAAAITCTLHWMRCFKVGS